MCQVVGHTTLKERTVAENVQILKEHHKVLPGRVKGAVVTHVIT